MTTLIATGGYSQVFSNSFDTVTKRVELISKCDENDDNDEEEIQYTTIRELAFLNLFKHPNISSKVSEKLSSSGYYNIDINLKYGGVTLYKWASVHSIKQRGKNIINIAFQVIKALYYLEVNNIVHADIKPSNIVINPYTNHVTLIDFGGCLFNPSEDSIVWCSTKGYIPPEHLKKSKQKYITNTKSDIFSFGLSMFATYFNESPDEKYVPSDEYDVLKAFNKKLEDLCHFEDMSILSMLLACIKVDNKDRPKASELYNFKCFSKLRKEDNFKYVPVKVDIPPQNEIYTINEEFKDKMVSFIKIMCSKMKMQHIYCHSLLLLDRVLSTLILENEWVNLIDNLDYIALFCMHITYILLDNSKNSKEDLFYSYEDYNTRFIDILLCILPEINFNTYIKLF
jgi:serine/threonine protein kinase